MRHKRVVITGAEGFIGSHTVEKLLNSGCEINAFVQYNSFGSIGWLSDLSEEQKSKINIVFGDIRDIDTVNEAMQGCSAVIHLAALIAIPYSYIAPESYFQTNLFGTLNILKAARKHELSRVIHLSTSEVYGSAQYVPIDEKHPIVGQSPYSASKISADQAAYSFFTSYNLPVVVARPFNTYGPRQSGRAVIPTILSQVLAGKNDLELGNITTTRDFNFVDDTSSALVSMLESDSGVGETFNIGTGFEISIENLVYLISEVTGETLNIFCDEKRLRPENSEVLRLSADNSKFKSYFDWDPKYYGKKGLKQGLLETFEWLANRHNTISTIASKYNI